jgi:outer membrane immunogenic protein
MRIRAWLVGLSLFLGNLAMAADIPVLRAPAPIFAAPPPILAFFTWTGCYAGGNMGGIWIRKDMSLATPSLNSKLGPVPVGASLGGHPADSWIGGVQGGCNYQIDSWVIGLYGDFDFTDAVGSHADPFFLGITDRSRTRSLGSMGGRVGYAWHRFLAYAKAGAGWERDNYELVLNTVAIALATETRGGWTAGVGVEYAFLDWLTGFIQYDYYGFGTRTNTFLTPAGVFFANIDIRERKNLLKAGFNIKFGPMSPVIGKW